MLKLGITGTDTGVGKTVVARSLLASLRARGVRAVGFKPIETGVTPGDSGSDAMRLMGEPAPLTLRDPVAPFVATGLADATGVDLDLLDRAFQQRSATCDAIVVEGAGGLLTPITATVAFDKLFAWWGLSTVIVTSNRLGALNHTMLTIRAATASRLLIRAIVLNPSGPAPASAAEHSNAAALRALVPGIPIIEFPWLPEPHTDSALAAAASRSGLDVACLDASPPVRPRPIFFIM